MNTSDRIDNPEVREYLYRYVPKKLNSIPFFVKVFGKDFARKRLKSNVIVVYTNESKGLDSVGGYHKAIEKSVTFCKREENDVLLTPEYMANNKNLLEIGLHESIHAVFSRNEKECKEFNISGGTGILERYSSADGQFLGELGRGLNEGFTEWLCEKAGYKTLSYDELTDFVRLLETAIGTENVIKLGKGGINQNFPQILNMSQEEVKYLLGLSDHLYKVYTDIVLIENLIGVLENNEEIEKYASYIEKYQKDPVYLDYIKKSGQDISIQSLKSYLKEIYIKELKKQKNYTIVNFESIVLDKFFTKDLLAIFEFDPISKDDFEKCKKIVSLLNSNGNEDKEDNSNFSSVIIKEKFEIFKKRYIQQIAKEQYEAFNNGKLVLEDFYEEIARLCGDSYNLKCNFFEIFTESIDGDFRNYVKRFFYLLYEYSENRKIFENVENIKMYKLISKDSSKKLSSMAIYDKDNFVERVGFAQQIIKKNSKEEIYFDFTLEKDCFDEYEVTMKNFLKLREEVFRKNPNSIIHISSRTIVVENNNEFQFYLISDGELVPMDVQNTFDINFSKKSKVKENLLLAPIKPSLWATITNKIRRTWNNFKNKNKENDFPNYQNNDTGQIVFNISCDSKNTIDTYKVKNFNERLAENSIQRSDGSIPQIYKETEENEK